MSEPEPGLIPEPEEKPSAYTMVVKNPYMPILERISTALANHSVFVNIAPTREQIDNEGTSLSIDEETKIKLTGKDLDSIPTDIDLVVFAEAVIRFMRERMRNQRCLLNTTRMQELPHVLQNAIAGSLHVRDYYDHIVSNPVRALRTVFGKIKGIEETLRTDWESMRNPK